MTDRGQDFSACRAAAVEAGRDELDAARECIPDEDELMRCLGSGRVTAAALASCVEAQLAGRGGGGERGEGTDPTTTVPVTTTTAVGPGIGPLDLPANELDGAGSADANGGDGDGGGLAVPAALAIAAATLVVGFVAGRAGRAGRRPVEPFAGVAPSAATAPPVAPAPPEVAPVGSTPADPEASRVAADRDQLVATLVDLAFEARSEAVRGRIVQQLAAVGVEPVVVAPGERFDPSRHRGIHAESASGPEQAETIATMERPGWTDRGRVLRPPEVVVRRWDGGPT